MTRPTAKEIKAIAEIAGVSPGITRIADHRMVADAAT